MAAMNEKPDAAGLPRGLHLLHVKRRDAPELHRALRSDADAPAFLRLEGDAPELAPAEAFASR